MVYLFCLDIDLWVDYFFTFLQYTVGKIMEKEIDSCMGVMCSSNSGGKKCVYSGASSGIVGASVGSRGGVSGRKGGSAATGTGSTSGLATTGASLEVAGSGLPQDTSPACKGKIAIGFIWARVR